MYSHREIKILSHKSTRINKEFQQPTKALDKIFSERVRRGKNSECRNSKEITKVSPQDLSCVAWHRTRMRSTTLSVSTDTKKNPSGRVRYSIKHNWNSIHDKSLSGACRITPVSWVWVQGLELEVGLCGFATRAINWYLIRQMNQPRLPLSMYNIDIK